MNSLTETEEKTSLDTLFESRCYVEGIKDIFPGTIFTRSGLARMQSCIGFILGVAVAGKRDMAEELSKTLLNSFRIGMSNEKTEINGRKVRNNWLKVYDDGSFLSFRFSYYGLMSDQNLKLDQSIHFGDSEYSYDKYQYLAVFHGGIIFHGLDQTFSVTIDGGKGWQMHT